MREENGQGGAGAGAPAPLFSPFEGVEETNFARLPAFPKNLHNFIKNGEISLDIGGNFFYDN